ncbi:retrotransposon protein [Cucumis melo var. makuwa]|uniref:Retrotransposon protein n=1 Tax=Cucumis melo var. makuwa TaxID=1194695 RepID=A0A5D3CBG4_CUCMM|nr:retrotransposon protein [Cucumis melo var. makuwa]TYK07706.1 retrotransposon protein [Cucumis melo var. makuwa]
MFKQFKAPDEGSLGARLIRIKQDGSYAKYLKKFLNYYALLPKMEECVLINAFVTGLETTLQVEVKSRHLVTLEDWHRCKVKANRELMFFIANEEEDLKDVDGKEAAESKVVELKTLEVNGETEITLRTILDFTSKGIMKLQGTVKEREIIILIDSDATYNFIHQGVAKKLSLLMEGKT